MHITETQVVGDGANAVSVYWFGDALTQKQYGICFPGAVLNIARQSLAESMSLASDVLADAVDALDAKE